MNSLYSDQNWEEFLSEKFTAESFPKKYKHLDIPLRFSLLKSNLHRLLKGKNDISRHSFLPFIRIKIRTPRFRWDEKKSAFSLSDKKRPISYSSHLDAAIYSFYSFVLNRIYLEYIKKYEFDHCVTAYRNDLGKKCNIQFAKEIFDIVRTDYSNNGCSALALDIKGYFDNIDHSILKNLWMRLIERDSLPEDQYKIFRSITNYSYVNLKSFLNHFNIEKNSSEYKSVLSLLDLFDNSIGLKTFKDKLNYLRQARLINRNNNIGIPQGSPISALLSNVFMIDFDKKLSDKGKELSLIHI